jgi:DNA mismatch endonuclease, patch repair protein
MADVQPKKPSAIITCPPGWMTRIKGKYTKPEIPVRKFLHAHGYRYRIHDKKLPGKPDIVLPKYRTVIFLHACLPFGRAVSGTYIQIVNTL